MKKKKRVRGVGSSHRGYSIFFGKFFKKARIFAEHNEIFRKIPIFGQIWSKLWPTHPDFGSKTDFIFAAGVPTIPQTRGPLDACIDKHNTGNCKEQVCMRVL